MVAVEKSLRLVIVTPEKTVFDEPVDSLRFPLYDGDIGILPGRLPLIGRLGAGELHVKQGASETRLFIDGGFVQVKQGVVTLLTDRALPSNEIDAAAAERELAAANERSARSDEDFRRKAAALNRARQLLKIARASRV